MINDNLRTLIASIEVANEEPDIDGLIISLDAKKAFDSVEHSYIRKTLAKFGFNSFIPIFNILYSDLRSDIIANGTILKGYQIKRGVKQGDALSCILFIMCMEPLIRNIERKQEIEPVHSNVLRFDLPKSLAYADDLTCIIVNNDSSVQAVFNEYGRLTRLSGLQLNADKTEILLLQSRGHRPPIQNLNFEYLNQRYICATKDEIKVNGLYLQMDAERMRTRNVDGIISKMTSHLRQWSKRGLSTLGKILVLKTFGVSQLIYLAQSMSLKAQDFKKFNALLFKFIWNRNFEAAKAPDRIKRDIINLPITYGGFGMLDIEALDRSLKLKMLARLTTSTHPFLEAIMSKINLNEFFFPVSNQKMDKPINQAISYLAADRQHLLDPNIISSDRKVLSLVREIRIKDILTEVGKASLIHFQLRRAGKLRIRDLSIIDLDRISRLMKNRNLYQILRTSLNLNIPRPEAGDNLTYWLKGLKPLCKLSAKEFRNAHSQWLPLCTYKIGAILSPIENSNWTFKLGKLTSTRHKNLLLRVAHGDWYSKERLFRFGLADDPLCESCGQIETISHKALKCQVKFNIWKSLARQENIDLDSLAEPMEFVLGMHKHENLASIVVHAELLSMILYKTPELPPERIIELVKNKLKRVDIKLRNKL